MEHHTLKDQALGKLKVADHLISTTYVIVKEPKLLVSVIDNISQALEYTIDALIQYEKQFKTIPSHNTSFEGKMDVFRRKIATKYDIPIETVNFIISVKKTAEEHKHSTVEFTKKEVFVISDENYHMTTLTIEEVKKTMTHAKHVIEKLFTIIKD